MNSAPALLVHAASAGKKPSAGTMKPPSPWIGSMRTAATLPAPTSVSIASMARLAAAGPSSSSRNG